MSLFSITFIIFLIMVLALYFAVPPKIQWVCLLFASYVFYMWADPEIVLYLLFTTISTFLIGLWLERIHNAYLQALDTDAGHKQKKEVKKQFTHKKRIVLAIGIVANFAVLGIVKYGNFAISGLNAVLQLFDSTNKIAYVNFLLPMGISFYTFQSVGYLIDVYRGKIKADRNLFQYALFVSYFPQIIQGPISRYHELAHQLYEAHTFDYKRAKFGAQRILWGFIKKLVIAERIAVIVDLVFNNFYTGELYNFYGFTVFMAVLLYGFQIYADFSGGIDIVCGVSEILGIQLTENFRRPFMAKSVSEFWQRWHMTLGSWMRDYVFYPLALSKPFNNLGKKIRKTGNQYAAKVIPTCLASFIVFTLIGIWHGANWKYFVFGLYSAFFVSTATLFEPFYAKARKFFRVDVNRFDFRCFQTLRTVFLVTIGRYFSRAQSLGQAVDMLVATFSKWNPWVFFDSSFYNMGLDRADFTVMVLSIVLLLLVDYVQERGVDIREKLSQQGIVFRWIVYFAAFILLLVFGKYGPGYDASNFIYQGF